MFLSGAWTQSLLANPRPDLGLMYQPDMGNDPAPLACHWWAADNGCFARGDAFDPDAWLAWLALLRGYRRSCLFAVAPDVIGNAEATLGRSRPYLPIIRQLGYRAAFVTQDGCRLGLVPWGEFDALFVGGSDAWKLSEASYALVAEARRRSVWVHMGRVNSLRRLKACAASGVQSADGTYLKYGPDVNLPKLWAWLNQVNAQGVLGVSA